MVPVRDGRLLRITEWRQSLTDPYIPLERSSQSMRQRFMQFMEEGPEGFRIESG